MTVDLQFGGVGRYSDRYPAWVADARGHSGVYVIRDLVTGRILYVGESHSARLYETMTRHFQSWSGPTAGPTYERHQVELAYLPTADEDAIGWQDHLICELAPPRQPRKRLRAVLSALERLVGFSPVLRR